MLRLIKTVLGIILRHPLPGATIVPLLADGSIVLVRRRDTGGWSLPGGIVDWKEDIPTTVKRELKEETGLDLISIKRLVGVYSSWERDPRVHSISILVEAEVTGEIEVVDQEEIMEARAFKLADLPLGTLSHDHDQQLQDYLQGVNTVA